jgi:UTP:GlnB (protein PII) uridylyltransferase
VTDRALLPITDAHEVSAFLQRVPLAVDRGHFAEFVLGFPQKYLSSTTAAEALKHYMLMESLRGKAVISSLSREGVLSKLCLVARDRSALFSRIAGALSSVGMDIVGAEAFANASAFVLDTFTFVDGRNRFADDAERRGFQVLLEEVVEGKADLTASLEPRLAETRALLAEEPLGVTFDAESYPEATALTVTGADHFGLLYLLTRALSEGGYNIEMAYIETPAGRVRDIFYLTCNGEKLSGAMQADVRERIARLDQIER